MDPQAVPELTLDCGTVIRDPGDLSGLDSSHRDSLAKVLYSGELEAWLDAAGAIAWSGRAKLIRNNEPDRKAGVRHLQLEQSYEHFTAALTQKCVNSLRNAITLSAAAELAEKTVADVPLPRVREEADKVFAQFRLCQSMLAETRELYDRKEYARARQSLQNVTAYAEKMTEIRDLNDRIEAHFRNRRKRYSVAAVIVLSLVVGAAVFRQSLFQSASERAFRNADRAVDNKDWGAALTGYVSVASDDPRRAARRLCGSARALLDDATAGKTLDKALLVRAREFIRAAEMADPGCDCAKVLIATIKQAEAQPPGTRIYPRWGGRESVSDYARRAGLEPSKIIKSGGAVFDFALIPAGEYQMGSPEDEPDRDKRDEAQRVTVLTRPFYLLKHEISQVEHKAIAAEKQIAFVYDNSEFPVDSISHRDCELFCDKLSALTGCKIRLPTEAEWEWACRAGDVGPGIVAGADDPAQAWTAENSGRKPRPVNQGAANAWGLFQMRGNAYEWCHDFYEQERGGGPEYNPAGPPAGQTYVMRGGSWKTALKQCRNAHRSFHSGDGAEDVGFRIVMEIPEQAQNE